MLKTKTAKELNLTGAEKKALIGVMGRLDKNELKHRTDFDMDKWSCGNIHCIGGWADAIYKTNFNCKPYDDALDELFFAREARIDRGDITPKQAAKAIKNFLTKGDPKWGPVTA